MDSMEQSQQARPDSRGAERPEQLERGRPRDRRLPCVACDSQQQRKGFRVSATAGGDRVGEPRIVSVLGPIPLCDVRGGPRRVVVAVTVGEASRRIAVGVREIRQSEESEEVRYMTGFDVGREPTRYRILFEELRSASTEREFDIEHVHNLVISDWAAEGGVEILVGDFRLER